MKQFLSIALFFTSSVAIAIEEKPVSSEQFGTCYGFYLGDYQSVRANQDEIVCFKNAVEQHVEISFYHAQEGKIDSLPETVVIAKLVSSETVLTPSKSKRVNIYAKLDTDLTFLKLETWSVPYSGLHGEMEIDGEKFTVYYLD